MVSGIFWGRLGGVSRTMATGRFQNVARKNVPETILLLQLVALSATMG